MNIARAASIKVVFIKDIFLKQSLVKKTVILAIIAAISWFGIKPIIVGSQKQQVQYQTAQAEKGTLITTVTASGTVSTGSNASITSNATGIVQEVYVENGDIVSEGDPIALIKLDKTSQQQQTQAWASYLSAKNNLESAKTNLYTLQAEMFGKWKTFKRLAENSDYQNSDGTPRYEQRALPEFHIPEKEWLAAEAKYKNQQAVITQAQVALNSAWLSYSLLSPSITAPMSGIVSNLSVTSGHMISASSQSSVSTNNIQSIGTITLKDSTPQVVVNLTEIDVVKAKHGQKATLTFDAFPDKTFTGRVNIINTNGSVTSGVTTYPTTISLDTALDSIYPNMAVNATIITDIKNNVTLVPSGAVQTTDGQSTVRVMRNGQANTVSVEVGDSNDAQTEIISGVSVGDSIVTGQTGGTATNGSTGTATSPFGNTRSGFGGIGTSGGGQFIQRR